MIDISKVIGSNYYEIWNDVEQKNHFKYWLKGGRGSLKGSFVYIYTIYYLTKLALENKTAHAVAMRKIKETIKDSCFTNLLWAIDILGLSGLWQYTTNPMKLWFKDNTILFRGCANQKDFERIKSIKFKKGSCHIAIFEELTEFAGTDEISNIVQSLFRGGDDGICFMMYNPPVSKTSWTNEECRRLKQLNEAGVKTNVYIHSSTYLEAPQKWLGKPFIEEANITKETNLRKYKHAYLAEEVGEGIEIFPEFNPETNMGVVEFRPITDDEIKTFTQINRGVDFGYSHATCYSETFYEDKYDCVYIFDEVYKYKASNNMLIIDILNKAKHNFMIGDSEDPRTINEFKIAGLNIVGAKKGKDSKPHGIKWLQDRARIIIDKNRCPNIASDFETYEFKKDKGGKIVYDYPDEPDGIASVRYSLERIILAKKWGWKNKERNVINEGIY